MLLLFVSLMGGIRESASCGYGYTTKLDQYDDNGGNITFTTLSLDGCRAKCNETCDCLGYAYSAGFIYCNIYTILTGNYTNSINYDFYLRNDPSPPPPASSLPPPPPSPPLPTTASSSPSPISVSTSCGYEYSKKEGQYDDAYDLNDNFHLYTLSPVDCRTNCSLTCDCLGYGAYSTPGYAYSNCYVFTFLKGTYTTSASFDFYLRYAASPPSPSSPPPLPTTEVSSPPPKFSSSSNSGSGNIGPIIGGAVAGLLVLLLIGGAIFYFFFSKKSVDHGLVKPYIELGAAQNPNLDIPSK